MSDSERLRRIAIRRLVTSCLCWGISFPVIKALSLVHGQEGPGGGTWFSAGVTNCVRFGLAAVIIAVMLGGRSRLRGFTGDEWRQGLGIGLFSALGMLLQYAGLAHTEASTSAFLTQASVIFLPLSHMLIRREWLGRRDLTCVALAIVGVAVLSGFDWHRFRIGRGEAETLLAALFFTGQILLLERPRFRSNHPLRVSLLMFSTIALVSAGLLAGIGAKPADIVRAFAPASTWVFLVVLIGPCTLMAFLWMNRWQKHVSATHAGLIYCLEPVFATGFAFFVPALIAGFAGITYANESITLPMIVGGGFVLAANLFMQWPPRRAGTTSVLNEHAVH